MVASIPQQPASIRYAMAAAAGAMAAALQWAIQPWVGSRIPFLFFLPLVPLAAMLLGRGPALTMLAIGMVNGIFLLPPTGELAIALLPDRISLLAYSVVGVLLGLVGARLHWITQRAADAEQRLRVVQENTGVGLFEIDLAERTILASAALSAMFGHTPVRASHGRMPLDEWNAALRAEDLRLARTLLRENLYKGATRYEHEHLLTLPDGQTRWFLTKFHIGRDGKGRPARLWGATLDITDRRRIDELLAKTQSMLTQQVADLHQLHELSSRLLELPDLTSQLQAILATLTGFHGSRQGMVSLYETDRQGKPAIVASIGFTDAELRQFAHMAPGNIGCGHTCVGDRCVIATNTNADPRFMQFCAATRTSDVRAVHCTPLVTAGGEVIGAMSIYLSEAQTTGEREMRLADICARKATVFIERARAQASAVESDRRFRTVLDTSAVPFSVLAPVRDSDGHIIDFRWTYANLAAAGALQRPVQELVGQCVQAALPDTWTLPGLFAHLVAVADTAATREFEVRVVTAGIHGWFHVVASPLPGAVAVWFADVTERRRQEQMLREADRRKDEFLATLAHELRNPLAPIRQAALIAKSPLATAEQKRHCHDVIDRQVRHMALLLEDLLDVSRITRGMLHLRKEPVELAAVIDAAVETAQPLIDARQHRLLVDLPPQPVQWMADPLRVSQVVANLLTNAAKYTDPGGTIHLHGECQDGALAISVTDSGIGIRQDALDDIFRMFTQVRSTQDRSGGGLGIGLALAKGLVALHGGSITAASAGVGKGSRFTVHLPLENVSVPASDADVVVPPQFARTRRILVADDNRDAAETLAGFLRLQGHELRIVYDGQSALREFAAFCPDVALLDIGMPGLSGNEVAQHIRSLPDGRQAMLIAITGWGQDKDRHRALSAGFDHHLTKPVDLQRLNLLLLEEKTAPPSPSPDQPLSANA